MSKVQVSKVHTFNGHKDCVYALEDLGDGHRFISSGGDGLIAEWDVRLPDQGKLIAKVNRSVYALHKAGNRLIIGENYEGIHVIDLDSKKETGSLKLSSAAFFDISSFKDNFIVGDGDGTLFIIDSKSMSIVKKVSESKKSVRAIAISETRNEMAVGYSDNHIRIFSLDNFECVYSFSAHDNSVFTVEYSEDGMELISGGRDARIKIWNAVAGYELKEEIVAHMYTINNVAFRSDFRYFVSASMDKSIKVWQAGDVKLLKVIDKVRHAGHGTSVNKLLWLPETDFIVSAGDDRAISVWELSL
ncbi:WD40 repeat domain-containing protein [Marinigracilibium pacificum]|uniref:WD40 repeat domain-containing protein n=1 Tax=Marinigracilibium pacificum TaxID=2729599 RepID=A0A848J4I5_9BACT|nr:WD40 repeat domain-containing protein [Marinigracilibium pacificum]NMM49384.1 WD40 repeat domain-containing protein [Marinigracilibium pacificum]